MICANSAFWEKKMALVKIDHTGHISTISLNRPDKKNALNPELVEALHSAFRSVETREETRAVVLTGEGDVFSAGADLAHIQQLAKNSLEENAADSEKLKILFHYIYMFPKPVVAKVNGHAIAGGAGLASACDIVLMSADAKIGYTEVKIGFIAAIVMVYLNRIVGEKAASDMLLSGRLLSAAEAQAMGLVSKVFEENTFDEDCTSYIEKLTRNSPQAQASTKALFRAVQTMNIDEALSLAIGKNAETRASSDCKEGIAAFLEKRKPNWGAKR